jgi:hypothetical protein
MEDIISIEIQESFVTFFYFKKDKKKPKWNQDKNN